jgi:prevent-host-death family protein
MQISVTELKANAGRYIDMADTEDVFITKNGKRAAKLVSARVDKQASVQALIGALPDTVDYEKLRTERILKW